MSATVVVAHDVEEDFDDEAVEADDTVVVEKVTIYKYNYRWRLEVAQVACSKFFTDHLFCTLDIIRWQTKQVTIDVTTVSVSISVSVSAYS